MLIVGISSSPRRGGNSETLLDRALEGAEASGALTRKIVLDDLEIAHVSEKEYGTVDDRGLTVVNDDMRDLVGLIREAGGVIMASPVFFGSLSSQAKTMIDRFQCVWLARNVMKMDVFSTRKRGAFISVQAAGRNDFFENSKAVVRHFFATINTEYYREVAAYGLEEKGAVLSRPDLLEKAYELGKRLAAHGE
ncbi:MAG: flavodoxin family protein [Candidatus Omnitrophica bacterium]|nr:flavodoxin family protein [Candidatus Omnitrophota bacterium]